MLALWGPDGFAIGGGTALAARWNHRPGTGIDITLDACDFSRTRDRLYIALEKAAAQNLDDSYTWLAGAFPEGEFCVADTSLILVPAHGRSREPDWGILVESTAEILARKLRLRMWSNDDFVTRDFYHVYDICTAAEMDPGALTRALETLPAEQRRETADKIHVLGTRAEHLGRTLMGVHRPEWLPDLAWRAAKLIHDGPERKPAPEKKGSDDPFALPSPFKPPSSW